VIVNAINNAIGAFGKTIDFNAPVNYRQGIDSEMTDLLAQMEAGTVGTLRIYGVNPVYTHYDGQYTDGKWVSRFAKAMDKVKVKISFNEKMDETTELCEYIIPNHHYLESWGDAEPKPGYTCFQQPTIFPLFKTRPFQTSLLRWSGNNQDYETYFKEFWTAKLGESGFNKALQDGVKEETGVAGGGAYSGGGVAALQQLSQDLRRPAVPKSFFTRKFLSVRVHRPVTPGCRNYPTRFPKLPGTIMR
jgi:hypothetical protein